MESTSTYWKPPFYLLEDTCECWLVNARDVKHVPGRPKTDRQDAVWLAKLPRAGHAAAQLRAAAVAAGIAGEGCAKSDMAFELELAEPLARYGDDLLP